MPKKAKLPPEEHENSERWTVTYSDLMNLLLVFFIVLYSTANQDTERAKEVLSAIAGAMSGTEFILDGSGDSILDSYSGGELTNEAIEARNMEAVKEAVEQMSEAMGMAEGSIDVVIDEIGVHIKIKDAVLFNSGSAAINANAQPVMVKLGEILKNLPNNYIQVEGHTDNIPMGGNPNIPTNWELGSLRAVNVLRMLVEKAALNPAYLNATSYGEFRPIDTNSTPEGRANNRRVEITILRNYAVSEM